jgi:predicted nucleic acid-binding protein
VTVVVDASAAVDAICLLRNGERVLEVLGAVGGGFVPAHFDAEALSALGRLQRAGELPMADDCVQDLQTFPVGRLPLPLLLPLAWSLRERIALRDALYVALALTLDASLLTTDRRLARAAEGLVPLA